MAAAQNFSGTGNPNGVVFGNPGDTYQNEGGGAGTTFWIKESGVNTATGWVAIAGPGFEPARTLFVAQSWPVGADPAVFFTTIGAAETQANTLTPTATNPVAIHIFPGTYGEATVTHVSNVHLIAEAPNTVFITNGISWLAGQGVNAGQAALNENVSFVNIFAQGTVTYDATAKTASSSRLITQSCQFLTTTITGRGTGLESCQLNNTTVANNNLTVTNLNQSGAAGGAELVGCRIHGATWAGTTVARFEGGEFVSAAAATQAVTGTASLTVVGVVEALNVGFTCAVGCKLRIAGCFIDTTITGAGDVDVRGCNFGGNADLTGITGTCNRTNWSTTFGPTAVGANVVPNAPIYPDATYNVHLQLVAGPGNAGTTVTAKLGASFTINDAVGGNTWDVTIIHD